MPYDRIGLLIRTLDSPNDNEVLAAAKALVKEMEGIGVPDALVELWKRRRVSLQRPKPVPKPPVPRPFDFTQIDNTERSP
jgi:hypothetical protein